jgi:hypothetical protein
MSSFERKHYVLKMAFILINLAKKYSSRLSLSKWWNIKLYSCTLFNILYACCIQLPRPCLWLADELTHVRQQLQPYRIKLFRTVLGCAVNVYFTNPHAVLWGNWITLCNNSWGTNLKFSFAGNPPSLPASSFQIPEIINIILNLYFLQFSANRYCNNFANSASI